MQPKYLDTYQLKFNLTELNSLREGTLLDYFLTSGKLNLDYPIWHLSRVKKTPTLNKLT